MTAFSGWLAEVLEDLIHTSQDGVVTEAGADDLLHCIHVECVRRLMAEAESWREDEDLREPAVDLLVRNLLVEAREDVPGSI